jgi:predicted DNA binding CopG/RHH family protein
MKDNKELKKFPKLDSEREAEDFVDTVDLSEYDFSEFQPVKFEFRKKSARINMRLPEGLLNKIKSMAEEEGVPYTRLIRKIIESHIEKFHPGTIE